MIKCSWAAVAVIASFCCSLCARGRRIVSNDGGAIGGTAELFVDRDTKIVIAYCANANSVAGRPLRVMPAMIPIFDP